MVAALSASQRTRIRRLPEKQVDERSVLDAVLDAGLVAHVAVVDDDQPFVLPMGYARDGDRLLLHGSTGSRLMRRLAEGSRCCLTVTLLDGLVFARSAFESSMRYRGAMVLGRPTAVPEEHKAAALDLLTDHLLPGRRTDLRAHHRKELAATLIVELAIEEWSVKVSDGWPDDDPGDVDLPVWAGVVPIRTAYGEPLPAPDLRPGIAVPPYVTERP
ncbi:MAG: uncharacterized protein QOE01_889 [Actinomycetota bacterium]|nr:uncharacterized protein [Actinomycetota bacterium]